MSLAMIAPLTIAEAAPLIERGELTPTELTEASIARKKYGFARIYQSNKALSR